MSICVAHPWLRTSLIPLILIFLTACEFPSSGTPVPISAAATDTVMPVTSTPQATKTPTPLPPLPTRAATAVPAPSPTHDPGLPEWTVLVYLDADNNLELSGLLDINEMEAAGSSKQVNLLVQIDRAIGEVETDDDWTEARRYLIRADVESDLIRSEPVEALGEVNMGDPNTLAQFISWGISNYPANRYALILWDHGAGWNGFAYDNDVGFPNEVDHITLPDLETALDNALDQVDVDKLNLIAFDACLMGQLELFQAVQPYVEFAVGSEELTPGKGWDYEALFRQLYANPGQDGEELAIQMVAEFGRFYSREEPEDFVTMAAVDLVRLPELTYAVESLATLLATDPTFAVGVVADARSGAEAYARVYADEFDHFAAVDLKHFASILSQRTNEDSVISAAQTVVDTVDDAVIAFEHGSGFRHSGGVSIYFPRTADLHDSQYTQVTSLPAWDAFLRSYHTAGLAEQQPPELHLTAVISHQIGLQDPAYLEFEIIGRDIENVSLVGGRYLEDGRRRLLEYDNLIPEPTHLPDDSQIFEWRDGLHEDFYIWDTRVTYLYDGAGNGDFVVMWPTDYRSPLFTVRGRFRRAADRDYVDASLLFDHSVGGLTRVWGLSGDAAAEISPQPGDEFQLYDLFWGEEGAVEQEPGVALHFDEQGLLFFDWRPLPDGDYFLGFVAENSAGHAADAFSDLTVSNGSNQPGLAAYLDPYLGFRFLYPDSWYAPVYQEELLHSSDLTGTTQLQVTLYPEMPRGEDARTLQEQTLNQFGPVDLLFPSESIVIGGTRGQRIVYGYDKAGDGLRTGFLVTLVHDGVGYVLDIDGPVSREEDTIAITEKLTESWQFKPARFGLQPGEWATIDLEAFSVAQPADFVYQQVNQWQRFSSNRHTFVALRTQMATLIEGDALSALIRDAGAGVESFQVEDPVRFPLSGKVWTRSNFSYHGTDGNEIWGFIMVLVEGGQESVAWAEAPASTYNELEPEVFLMMIADMSLNE